MKRKESTYVRFLPIPDMPDVRAVMGRAVDGDFARHVHDSFTIGLVDAGTREIRQDGVSTLIGRNGLFVINPGVSHACRPYGGAGQSYRAISVHMELVKRTASQISEKSEPLPWFKGPLVDDGKPADNIRRFFSLLENGGALLERETILLEILGRLIRIHSASPPPVCPVGPQNAAVERTCEYIRAHTDGNISLKDLAKVACLSPFHLQRVFVAAKGVSPHEYLLKCRIQEGCRLLLQGRPIAHTALETGFHDQSHFTRFFKRFIGIPPGRFIKINSRDRRSFNACR